MPRSRIPDRTRTAAPTLDKRSLVAAATFPWQSPQASRACAPRPLRSPRRMFRMPMPRSCVQSSGDRVRYPGISGELCDPYRGGSFGSLPAPGGLPFGFARALAFVIDLAHEFTLAEHADDSAPVLARVV